MEDLMVRLRIEEDNKKSEKKRKKLRSKIFKFLFQGIEAIWMLVQIIQYVLQIFK